jgi:hypothetical protein
MRDGFEGAEATGSAPRVLADGMRKTSFGPRRREIEFAIDPSRVLRILLLVTAVLVALSTAGQVMVYSLSDFPLRDWLANLFYVDGEQNLPSLYSSMMLIVSALLFGVIAHAHRRDGRPYVRHWAALSLVFVLLALDEFASMHEASIGPLRALLNIESGPFWFAWVIPAAAAVAVFGIAFMRFLGHLPRSTRRRLWTAGLLFVGGALGVELIGGSYSAVHENGSMAWVLIVTIEETLEMLGVVVLVYGLLTYLPVGLPDTAWRLRVAAVD